MLIWKIKYLHKVLYLFLISNREFIYILKFIILFNFIYIIREKNKSFVLSTELSHEKKGLNMYFVLFI